MESRILLVDDDHDNSLIFKIGLQDAGFEVDAYSDPELALSAFKPGHYDILLLDIKMPKMDGYELNEKIRKTDNKVKVCFLTTSEKYKEEHRPSFLSAGSLIIKPITIDDNLVKKVNETIGWKTAKRIQNKDDYERNSFKDIIEDMQDTKDKALESLPKIRKEQVPVGEQTSEEILYGSDEKQQ